MTIIQHRRGTTAEWAASSYILEAGEIGVEINPVAGTNNDVVVGAKIGNGESLWANLDYIGASSGLNNIVEDTTPQLGGDLDAQGYDITNLNSFTLDTTPTSPGTAAGTIFWDSGDGIPKAVLNANVTVGLGQESIISVKNATGSTITKGTVVYINGAQGQMPTIALADADTEATSSKTFGFAAEEIVDGAEGFLVTEGVLRGINTGGLTEGNAIYLSSTAGQYTQTIPEEPAHMVFLGYVVKAHASAGEIVVKIQNGYELTELHGVTIETTLADNELLAYDSASGLWKNQTAAEAGLATPSDISTAIANLIDSAPTTLDTLNELAAALGDDPNFATTITDSLADKQPLDSDLTAIAALTGTSGFLKKTAANTWTLDTNTYLTGNQSISISGDASGSGTTAISLILANSGVTAGTYRSVTVDAKGRVTAGTNPTTLSGYGITDAAALAGANFTGNINVTSATTTLDSKFLNSSGTGIRFVATQSVSGGLPGVILSPYVDNVEQTSSQLYYASSSNRWVFETDLLVSGATTSTGAITANGGITGAAAKNMTVVSGYSGTTFAALSPRVIMTATQTGAADPTTRPDGTALVAGDVWIDW